MELKHIPYVQKLIHQTTQNVRMKCKEFADSIFQKNVPRIKWRTANDLIINSLVYFKEEIIENYFSYIGTFVLDTLDYQNWPQEKVGNLEYIDIQTKDYFNQFPFPHQNLFDIQSIFLGKLEKIIIKKDRELQSDQSLQIEWKNARIKFLKNEIKKQLNQKKIGEEQQTKILRLFMEAKQNPINNFYIDQEKLGELYKYRDLIESLNLSFYFMNISFSKKPRECLVLSRITSNKLTNLKLIHIQYQSTRYYQSSIDTYHYSISAFALFNFIDANPQLESVTIKAVQLLKIQQFLQNINTKNKTDIRANPQKIVLNFKIQLNANYEYSKAKILQTIKSFKCFVSQFICLSDITVNFKQFKANQIDVWKNYLNELLFSLGKVKNIKIEIQRCDGLFVEQLLSGISQFTEIASLKFQGKNHFSPLQVFGSEFSVIQSSLNNLNALIKNNKLTNLEIKNYCMFPALPIITTLESIDIYNVQFREEFDLNEFIKANKSLRSIRCSSIQRQKWVIEEQLINRLQTLQINYCEGVSFEGIHPSKSSYSLKYLKIYAQNISEESLQEIFPKLVCLKYLDLYRVIFGEQLLSKIPSFYLEELYIWYNSKITGQCWKRIDDKWPGLRIIHLGQCRNVTNQLLNFCRFKNLIELKLRPWDKKINTSKFREQGIIIL